MPVQWHVLGFCHFRFDVTSCLTPTSLSQIVLYLRMCLAYSAGATPVSKSLADMQDDAPAIGCYINTLLTSDTQLSSSGLKGSEANPVHIYMDLLQQLLSAIGGEGFREVSNVTSIPDSIIDPI